MHPATQAGLSHGRRPARRAHCRDYYHRLVCCRHGRLFPAVRGWPKVQHQKLTWRARETRQVPTSSVDLRDKLRPVTAPPSSIAGRFFGTKSVDFFERYLGFSGGRGDGSLEVLFLVALGMIVLVTMSHLETK